MKVRKGNVEFDVKSTVQISAFLNSGWERVAASAEQDSAAPTTPQGAPDSNGELLGATKPITPPHTGTDGQQGQDGPAGVPESEASGDGDDGGSEQANPDGEADGTPAQAEPGSSPRKRGPKAQG